MRTADHPTAFRRKLGRPGGWLTMLRRLVLRPFVGGGRFREESIRYQNELKTIAASTAELERKVLEQTAEAREHLALQFSRTGRAGQPGEKRIPGDDEP